MSRSLILTGVVASCLLAGCSAGANDAPPAATSTTFYDALRSGQPERACGLLADQTRQELEESEGSSCPEALAQVGLSAHGVTRVDVYGRQALVEMDGDSLFLAQQSAGWQITAAGCTAHEDEPYDCQVEAG